MRFILGGKFECALVRGIDSFNRPSRNSARTGYYAGLNRQTEKEYFDRMATFVAIAEGIDVSSIDWSEKPSEEGSVDGSLLDIRTQVGPIGEWDPGMHAYVKLLLAEGALSGSSLSYIGELDLSDIADDRDGEGSDPFVAEQYLCRLFLQIRTAGLDRSYLVLSERDLRIVSEVGRFAERTRSLPPFPFPALDHRVVIGSKFAGGVFNFSPNDAHSLVAIRADKAVRAYAGKVRDHLAKSSTLDGERGMVDAMLGAYDSVLTARRVDRVFEVVSWLAKPLHYVPGVDAALTAAEDAKDLALKVVDRERDVREWYLLAARATEVGIEDYLRRKRNLSPS